MRRRDIIRSTAFLSLGAVSTSIFGSCVKKSEIPAVSPEVLKPVGSQGQLRIALIPWIGWAGAHIADVRGFFKDEGLDVKQTVYPTGPESNAALFDKKADLAWLVALDLLVYAEKIPDLKFIYGSDYSGGVDAIVGNSGIKNLVDLKGKKIAREDIPYEIVFTSEGLKSVNLKTEDVSIVSLTVPDAYEAFKAGKVDAATLYDPFIGKALKAKPGSKVLYTAKNSNTIGDGLVGDSSVLKSRRSDILAYLRAIDKGTAFMKAHPKEANEIVAKWMGVTPAEVAAQVLQVEQFDLAKNKSMIFNEQNPLNVMASIDSAAPILRKAGKISKVLAGKDLVDDSFVKAL
jgi:NitT/TauT family transport system substrate-binding protein